MICPAPCKKTAAAVGMSRRITAVPLGVPCEAAGWMNGPSCPSSFRWRSKKKDNPSASSTLRHRHRDTPLPYQRRVSQGTRFFLFQIFPFITDYVILGLPRCALLGVLRIVVEWKRQKSVLLQYRALFCGIIKEQSIGKLLKKKYPTVDRVLFLFYDSNALARISIDCSCMVGMT